MRTSSTVVSGAAPIPPTLSLQQAVMRRWQVVIAGAGPAGAAAAIRLARAGLQVLLVDRDSMPRGKVCGCCLSPVAMDELDRLGLSATALGGVPLERVRLAAAGRIATIEMPRGEALSRETLDAALVREAVASGAHWLPHVDVVAIADAADADATAGVAVHVREPGKGDHHEPLRADYAIVAAGLFDHVRLQELRQTPHQQLDQDLEPATRSATAAPRRRVAAASRIGLGAILDADAIDLPAGELVMAVGRRGYCGLVRLEDGRIDLAAAVDREGLAAARSAACLVRTILGTAFGDRPLLRDPERLDAAAFRATPPLTHASPLAAGPTGRILRIGDAAGYVEPFTGEGIGWALATARLLAEAVVDGDAAGCPALRPVATVAARYTHAYQRAFRSHHARCRRVARSLRSPVFVAAAVGAAQVAPWAARRLVPAITGGSPIGRHDR